MTPGKLTVPIARCVGFFAALPALVLIAGCATRGSASGGGDAPANPTPPAVLLDPSDASWRTRAPETFSARFETTRGVFIVDVVRAWAPQSADRFYNLVRNGFYDECRFTRVLTGYIVQFGLHGSPEVSAAWRDHWVALTDTAGQSNVRGTIGFAMTPDNRLHSQLYINLVDNVRLDPQGFAIFGRVSEGMAVVDSLHAGYGANSGGGIRGGQQGPLERGGNAYIDREWPLLDHIVTARIIR
jgi:homoserine O-acetyltransferase